MDKRKRLRPLWPFLVAAVWGCAVIGGEDANVARRQGWEFALIFNGVTFIVVIAALLVSLRVLRSRRRARERQDLYRRLVLALGCLAEDRRPQP
jgi:heme/copper-type cytochrome/quinol oxidase subunit 2